MYSAPTIYAITIYAIAIYTIAIYTIAIYAIDHNDISFNPYPDFGGDVSMGRLPRVTGEIYHSPNS